MAERAGARLRLAGDHTVVALAGATGSGKSSTFNALTGLDLAASAYGVPPRRGRWPAPGAPTGPPSCSTGSASRSGTRSSRQPARRRGARTASLDGLVLLDLPDHDSTEVAHHVEVDRLVKLADLLVWVLDPQKYADAAIHERYLRPLATHRDIMLVVLNHIDEVAGRPAASRWSPTCGGCWPRTGSAGCR